MINSLILRQLCRPFVNIFLLSERDAFLKDTTGKHPHLDSKEQNFFECRAFRQLAGGWGNTLSMAAGFLPGTLTALPWESLRPHTAGYGEEEEAHPCALHPAHSHLLGLVCARDRAVTDGG